MLRRKPHNLKRRRKQPLHSKQDKNESSYINKGVYTPIYIFNFKSFCLKCLNSLETEKGFKEIKTTSLKSVVYSAKSDVVYIYMNDKHSAQMLMETLSHWFVYSDPLFKGCTLDKNEQESMYIIELNYMDIETIKRNKEANLQNIVV